MTDDATIVLETTRRWVGKPSLGAFVITLDGERAGSLMPQSTLTIACTAGIHRLRARQWWYLSPSHEVTVASGDEIHVRVDLAARGLKGWLTLMFRPWRGVAIILRERS